MTAEGALLLVLFRPQPSPIFPQQWIVVILIVFVSLVVTTIWLWIKTLESGIPWLLHQSRWLFMKFILQSNGKIISPVVKS